MQRTNKTGLQRLASSERKGKSGAERAARYNSLFYKKYGPSYHKNPIQKSTDTVERQEIHKRIKVLVSEGKNKTEIVATLINEFPESKLRDFFETYTQHHLNKKPKQPNTDGEEHGL